MIVVNTETIPGKMIVELKGLVQGNTVRAKHFGRDLAASFKNLVGGELKGYTELLVEARREAVARMIAQAEELQANAIVNVRFATISTKGIPKVKNKDLISLLSIHRALIRSCV